MTTLTSNSKMLCKTDQPNVTPEYPRTANHARRCQERTVTRNLALEAKWVEERSKTPKRVRTIYSGAVEEGRASTVPGRLVGHRSLEGLLVVPNGLENRREWRSVESDCSDLLGLFCTGSACIDIEYIFHEKPTLYTVISMKQARYQASGDFSSDTRSWQPKRPLRRYPYDTPICGPLSPST